MVRLFCVPLVALVVGWSTASVASAQSAPTDPVAEGYELLASGHRLEAVRHFEGLMAARPGALAPAFGALAARHGRLEVDEAEQGVFEVRLDQFITDVTARHKRSDRDDEALFYLAQAHMLRGGYRFEYDKGMWGAARDGAKAKNYSDAYIARQPNHGDAYLTLGLYNYYVALAPSLFKAVGWMLFLPSGNRIEGLKQVERAAASGHWFAPRAKLLLMDIYGSIEHRPTDALALGQGLQERYPGNDNVGFSLADLYLAAGVEDRDRAASDIDAVASRFRATLALASVRQEQWRLDDAIALLTTIVDAKPARPTWALPQALLRRSNYRALLNDPGAVADARLIQTHTQLARWREAAAGQIKWIDQQVASGEAAVYSALIPGNRHVADKRWGDARRAYDEFRARDPQNPQLRYRLAYLSFASGDAERAVPEMTALAAVGRNPDWLKAGALLVVARAHDLAGRREQAKRVYQTIVDRYEDQRPAAAARLGLLTPYVRPA